MDTTIRAHTIPETKSVQGGWAEIVLLLIGGGFAFVNLLALSLERGMFDPHLWLPLVVWLVCAVIGSRLLNRRLPNRDRLLFPLALMMSGWGLVLIERLAPNFADRQVVWLAVSVAALLVIVYVPRVLRILRAYRYILLLIGLGLLVATIILGRNPSGLRGAPELWLGVGT